MYVQNVIRLLGPTLYVISVYQPIVPVLAALVLMASAKHSRLPKSMTMVGGPIDPSKPSTDVNDLATEKPLSWFERTIIYKVVASNYPGFDRKVYLGFLQDAGFVVMNSSNHAQSH